MAGPANAASQTTGVVFIDARTPDLQTLLNGLAPGRAAFVIDADADGLAQAAAILSEDGYGDLASIAFVGHGSAGLMDFGASVLSDGALPQDAAELRDIASHLAAGGQLQLYACDTASGPLGRTFVADLASAAGVETAASTHTVGGVAQGGDFILDTVAGGSAAPSAAPFTAAAEASYQGALAATGTTAEFFANYGVTSPLTLIVADVSGTSLLNYSQRLTNDGSYFSGTHAPYQIVLDTVDNLAFFVYSYTTTANSVTKVQYRIEESRISDLLNSLGNPPLAVVYDTSNDSTHSAASNGPYLAGVAGQGNLQIDTANHLLYWADNNAGGYAPTYLEKISYSPTSLGYGTSHTIIAQLIDVTNNSTGGYPGGFNGLAVDYTHNVAYITNVDGTSTYTDANYIISVNLNTGSYSKVILDSNYTSATASQENLSVLQSNFFSLNYGELQDVAVDPANEILYFTTRRPLSGETGGIYKLNLTTHAITTIWSQTAAYGNNPSGSAPDGALGEIYIDVARGKYYVEVDGASGTTTKSTDTNIFEGNLTDVGVAPTKLLPSPVGSGTSGDTILSFVADTAPTLSITPFGTTWTQGGSAVRILASSTASDQDANASQLASASVSITTGFLAGDTLAATTTGTNVTASYVAGTGVLTLSGVDTFAHYQQVLNSVTFSSTSANPTNYHADTSRTLTIAVSDGLVSSPAPTTSIGVQGVDQPGYVGGATYISLQETNAALSGTRTLTFSDPDTNTASAVTVTYNSYTPMGSGSVNTSGFGGYLTGPGYVSPGGTGTLTFNSGSETFDYLAAGQILTLNYTLGWSGGTTPFSVTVSGANDAPVTSGTTQALAGVQGGTQPAGQTLSSLLASHVTDVDDGSSLSAVAVTANGSAAASGKWQYSSDAGSTWTDVGAASPTAAVLIHAADLVCFLPATGFTGAAPTLTVHAVDDTQAAFTDGSTVSLATTGGTTPYSTGAIDLTETVTPADHPPVLGGAASGQATGDTGTISPFAAITVADVDADQTETVTVTYASADGALAGGGFAGAAGSYTFSGSVSDAQAALRALVFTPTANQVAPGGTVTTVFTVAVNDGVVTTIDATTSVVATSVNDAPVLNAATVVAPAQVLEGSQPAGQTVASLVGAAFSDADAGSSLLAIAVTGNASGAATGQWQVSSNGGATWADVGVASPAAAVLVHATSLLRFLPAAGFSGATPALSIHLVDDTQAPFADGAMVSLATTGGTTAYSAGVASLSTTVAAVNHAPSFAKGADQTVNEDAGPQAVSGWATAISPGPAAESGQTVSFTASAADTALFSVQPTVSASGMLTYTPAPNANGSTTVTVTAHDDGGTANGGMDTSAPQTFTITLNPVNDAPVVTAGSTAAFTEGGPAAAVAPTATVSDIDSPSFAGGSVTVHLSANGTASDQLSLVDQGSGAGRIGVAGDAVSYGGTALGTVSGGANGADLVIALTGAAATPAAVQALLRDIAFSNTSSSPSTAPRTVSLAVVDGGGTANGGHDTGATTATVTVTAVNTPPAIGGTAAGQAVTDKAAATPFAAVAVTDPDSASLTATLTVTAAGVASDANGVLSGSGLTKTGVGTYALNAGSPLAVSAALAALTFTPTPNQVAPGSTVTTGFTLAVGDGQATVTDTTTTVVATSVNDAPTLMGAHASGVDDRGTLALFSGVTVGDPDTAQTETATITYAAAAGALSYAASAPGVTFTGAAGGYTLSAGSAAALTTALQAVSFTPTAAAAGSATQTTFSVFVSDGAASTAADTATAVTVSHTTNAPVSASNTAGAGQSITDKATTTPFAGVDVSDGGDAGQTYRAAITYTAANGALAFAASQSLPAGTALAGSAGGYTLSADTAAHLQAALQALTFTPTANQVLPGQQVQTVFAAAVSDLSGATILSTTSISDTVSTTSVNDAPALTGTHASSASGAAAVALFSGVTVADADTGQTETATVSFAAGSGALSGAGTAAVANGVATYTVSAASAQALTTALQAVTFTPAAAPTSTTVTLAVGDGTVSTAADIATVVTAVQTTALVGPGQTLVLGDPGGGVVSGDVVDDGTVQLGGATSPTVSFTGSISGPGGVQVSGGTVTFTGVSTYTGTTSVQGGLLVVDGSIASSPVMVGSGGTLGGHGTTGPVTLAAGATFSPGNSPGLINTGSLILTAGASYKEEIGGYGSGLFDVVNVTGAVSLNGATLNTSLYGGFTTGGASGALVIINNDETDAVVGTFAGLPEGATFSLGGATVQISYVGGTGNDVTLTVLAATTPVTTPTNPTTPTTSTTPTTPVTPTGPTATTAPSIAAGLATQVYNLSRAAPTDTAITDTASPLYGQMQQEKAIAAQLDVGLLSPTDAQTALFHLFDATTSVAEISYAFFTGKTPTAAGLNYLVHSSANPTDLNDAYYAQFSTENRYINFAANLGRFGDGTSAFHAAYDSLSLADATAKAYQAVFGAAASADKVDAILNSLVPDGRGGTETRAQYFAYYGTDGLNGVGTKAAMIGWLLSDSVKEGFGTYQAADQHFLQALANGTAAYNVDLIGAYGAAPTLVGQPVIDATLGG